MTKRILFLAANPLTTDRLRIDEEIREITDSLERAQKRSHFEIVTKWAVRFKDLRKALLDVRPHIVHFSGHAQEQTGIIMLEGKDGRPQHVSADVLGDLFRILESVECVVLNACYTDDQGTEIAKHVNYVIAKRDSFLDVAAIAFSVSFYETFFAGYPYEKAFQIGCNTLQYEYPDESVPLLIGAKTYSPNGEGTPIEYDKKQVFEAATNVKSEPFLQTEKLSISFARQMKQTRTFRSGVIENVEEYRYEVRFGMLRTLPPLPQANDDCHVIVVKVKDNQSSVFAVLTRPNHAINPSARDVDQLVFIVFSVKPQCITIPTPQDGYLLRDGQIDANIKFTFYITDVEQFWHSEPDPVAKLELQIINQVAKHMSKMNAVNLVNSLLLPKVGPEQQSVDSRLRLNHNFLADMDDFDIEGVRVEQLHISIILNARLNQLVEQLRSGVLNQESNFVDTFIKIHTDFMQNILKSEDRGGSMNPNEQLDRDHRFDQHTKNFVILRNLLAGLYPDSLSIRRIVDDASIDKTRIDFDAQAINSWHAVLTEAAKIGRVDALLGVVELEYRTNEKFRNACDVFRQSTVQANSVQNDEQEQRAFVSPTKLIRECLEEGFDARTIRSFCDSYLSDVAKRIAPHDGLDEVITSINSFCGQHAKFEQLWQAIKAERPASFAKYYPQWKKHYR